MIDKANVSQFFQLEKLVSSQGLYSKKFTKVINLDPLTTKMIKDYYYRYAYIYIYIILSIVVRKYENYPMKIKKRVFFG